jgi:type II secretory pathway pseudopilin PulG
MAQDQAPPLADKLPQGPLAYLGWAGGVPVDGTATTQPADLMKQMLEQTGLAKDPKMAKTMTAVMNLAMTAAVHPAGLAILEVAPHKNGPPEVSALALFELGQDKAAFATNLANLLEQAPAAGVEVLKTESGLSSVSTPAGAIQFGFAGNSTTFCVAIGKGLAQMQDVAAGKAKPLSAQADFVAAVKDAAAGGKLQGAFYLDAPKLYALIDTIAAQEASNPKNQQQMPRQVIGALGLSKLTSVTYALSISPDGELVRLRLASKAPHTGLMKLLAGKPLSKEAISRLPADTTFAVAFGLDPAVALAEIKAIAGQIEPKAPAQMDGALEMVKTMTGLDIPELASALGDDWMLVSAPSLGGLVSGTYLSVGVKDAAKAAAAVTTLEGLVSAAAPFAFAATKVGQTEIRYMVKNPREPSRDFFPFPLAPAWAIRDGRLYIAAWPQVLSAAIKTAGQKGLLDLPENQAARKRFSPNPNALMVVNTPQLARLFYGFGLGGMSALGNSLRNPQMLTALPDLTELEKMLGLGIVSVSADDNGISVEGNPQVMMAPAGVAMAVSVALPTLGRARAQAKQALSMANLNAIGKAIVLYQNDQNEQFPPDLQALVKKNIISNNCLLSPTSGRKPESDAEGKLVGGPDYVYLGNVMGSDAPPNLILAYEPPQINNNEGAAVLFTDYSVRWVKMAEFQKLLKQTEEYIKNRK